MAARKKALELPDTILVSVSGTPDRPYYTVHRADLASINQDVVVGVYKLKKKRLVKLTRSLERPPKE